MRQLTTGSPAVSYTWQRALWAAQRNLGALPGWVTGGTILAALAAMGLYRFRRSAWAWALAAVIVTVPLGYLFYWGNLLVVAGRRSIGPHYYLALLVPLAVLGSVPLAAFSRRRRAGGALIVAAVLVGTGLSILPKVQLDRRHVALHNRERRILDSAHLQNAVVFLPNEQPDGAWLMHPRPSFMNDPDLRQSVLFALDHKGDNFDLVDRYPRPQLLPPVVPHPATRPGPPLCPHPVAPLPGLGPHVQHPRPHRQPGRPAGGHRLPGRRGPPLSVPPRPVLHGRSRL